jgi:HemY protein
MRRLIGLWVIAAVAVTTALFAGKNQATLTLFWSPYRFDVSLNLALLALVGLFIVLHISFRAFTAIAALPAEARRWRLQFHERGLQQGLLDALSHLAAGRFISARKAAEALLAKDTALTESEHPLPYANHLRAIAHLLAAEGAHALQDVEARVAHSQQALAWAEGNGRSEQEMREGLQLRTAAWLLDDRNHQAALQQLEALPQGAARRTLALKLRLNIAQQTRQTRVALETARQLGKHRALFEAETQSLILGLAIEHLRAALSPADLTKAWSELHRSEQDLAEVAWTAADRWLQLGGDAQVAMKWAEPFWSRASQTNDARWAHVMTRAFLKEPAFADKQWLFRIESAQAQHPAAPLMQYLYGLACWRFGLWGKSQTLLQHALQNLADVQMRQQTLILLAQLADQNQDSANAQRLWREAATASSAAHV